MAKLVTERAVVGGFSGRVAIHAVSHTGRYFFGQDIPLIHGPVAASTLFTCFQVARMTEEDKVRDPVYSHPFHFFSPPMGFCQFLDLGTVSHHRVMADHALLRVRQPRLRLPGGTSMALKAGQADCGMLLMAEGDRLWRDGKGELLFFPFIDNRLLRK